MSFEQTSNPEYSTFIALSKYARWLPEKQRRETWEETVNRYIDFWVNKGKITEEEGQELYDAIYTLEVMPSMRALMTAGVALDRDNVAGFNCSYKAIEGLGEGLEVYTDEMYEAGIEAPITINISKPIDFDESMYILTCGTGLGFSCERQYISNLPTIGHKLPRKTYKISKENYPGVPVEELSTIDHNTIRVADSKYGWASALRILIVELYNGNFWVNWDMSEIRPAGEPLKTFGGRASGPDPLVTLFSYCREVFKKANKRKLTSIEVHGIICKIAEVVVVGSVRRSALLSLSNLSDSRMRTAKSGQWWNHNPEFALSNNSVAYTEKPDSETFLREWLNLVESKSGERGIFNRVASQKRAAVNGRRDTTHAFGTNPCCFTGDMRLLTDEGYQSFNNLSKKDSVNIMNPTGKVTKGKVWETGMKEIVAIKFLMDKPSIYCTSDHIFKTNDGREVAAENLRKERPMPHYSIKNTWDKEEFLAGFIQGNGATSRLLSKEHKGLEVYFSKKDIDIAETYDQKVGSWYSREARDIAEKYNLIPEELPYRYINEEILEKEVNDFIAGLFSANGCIIKKARVALKTTCETLAKQVKNYLSEKLGITAYITTNRGEKVKFSNGDYICKESYDLNISNYADILTFAKYISFGQEYKRNSLEELIICKAPYVCSVKPAGKEMVYDFSEPETHWGIVENCVVHNSEIILRDSQFCNLSEVIVRENDSMSDLMRKVRLATILGTLQATLTNFIYLNPKWKQNTEEEALLGVSMTGIMDHPVLSGKLQKSSEADFYPWTKKGFSFFLYDDLEDLRKCAVVTNEKWAKRLKINQSAAITCVKPSGTVSQLVDCASGIHPRYSEFYIRTVRADKKDPLAKMMVDQGFPYTDDVTNSSTYVFSFPMRAPSSAIFRNNMSALQQAEHWLIWQRNYCEHKPSITIYYKENEIMELGAWVYNHFDEISGISFLPYSDHVYKQAPYKEITEREYNDWLEIMPDSIDWSRVAEYEDRDNTSSSQTLACSAGGCDIVDLLK